MIKNSSTLIHRETDRGAKISMFKTISTVKLQSDYFPIDRLAIQGTEPIKIQQFKISRDLQCLLGSYKPSLYIHDEVH
jgi:hypothetical protein